MLFCPDFSPQGRQSGYGDLYLRHCLPFLAGVYFDNATYIDEVKRHFAIPDALAGRLVVLRQPVVIETASPRPQRPRHRAFRVLWASRIARQKNIDLLLDIAESAPDIEFHLWGRGDAALEARIVDAANNHANLRFGGPFDRFDALPLHDYDAFLYTSRWDGIPNVLLEAAASGLPIVSSHVGGIGELIDDATGWLVADLNEAAPYVAALRAIRDQPGEATKRITAMASRLEENHDRERYRQILASQPLPHGLLAQGGCPPNEEVVRGRGSRKGRPPSRQASRPIITAILNVHREGLLLKPSLESLKRAANHARSSGVRVELLAVLDRADELTRQMMASEGPADLHVLDVDFGDLGQSRNHAVTEAQGRYVAFLDADDLWGTEWLTRAAESAASRQEAIIWHPEISAYFGAERHLFHHIDMEDPSYDPVGLMIENYWTALSFGLRSIYLDNPYPDTDLRQGWGFEDWAWNMGTISRGIIHKTVPGTGHVIRRKSDQSLAAITSRARAVPRPNDYIRNLIASPNARSGL